MANRSRTEIVSQILETIYDHDGDDAGEGITQTKIMYEGSFLAALD
jgi:predicted transcriptional regulator